MKAEQCSVAQVCDATEALYLFKSPEQKNKTINIKSDEI